MKRTPALFNRDTFNSLPRRFRLSKAVMSARGNFRLSSNAMVDPTKPAPPVMTTRSGTGARLRERLPAGGNPIRAAIVAARQMLLQPQVEHHEQVAAAHLLEFELRDAGLPVAPGDWDNDVRIAAYDGL